MALRPEKFPKFPPALLWARLPVQGLFAWLTWRGYVLGIRTSD